MKRMQMIAVSGLATVALMTGCSSTVLNQGGDTKCSDFSSSSEKEQNDTITKMLKDKGKGEPANLELDATRAAVQTYCQTMGTPDTKISETPLV